MVSPMKNRSAIFTFKNVLDIQKKFKPTITEYLLSEVYPYEIFQVIKV